jgi:hypothetical protein
MPIVRALVCTAFVIAMVVTATRGAEVEPRIAVIVGKTSFIERVTTDDLRELYLRRRRVWRNGERALPVNLPPGTAERERFSARVLGRRTDDLRSYWNARWFEGITPPPVLPTPAAVCAFVNAEPAAIGYVPFDEAGDCRTLLVLD